MVASPSVTLAPVRTGPQTAASRPLLACNCAMVVRKGLEVRTIRTRSWDCPSCGLDKRNRIAEMAQSAGTPDRHPRMLTMTFSQPRQEDDGVVPDRHADCDPSSHLYEYRQADGKITLRWRLLSTCPHCCRYVSAVMVKFRKRLRRMYGDQVDYLWAREDHPKSGAIHLHSLWVGLPQGIARNNRAGRRIKAAYAEAGGGLLDLGYADADAQGRRVGWYIGKYLAKRHDQRMAKGFRRWSRTRGFAPEVLMQPRFGPPQPWANPSAAPDILGFVDPLTRDVRLQRVWYEIQPTPGPPSL